MSAFVNVCISRKEVPYFRIDAEKIHRFFYEESKKNKEFFQGVIFDTRGIFPYCEDVEGVFINLEHCRMLRSFGLDFNPNQFSKKILNIYKRVSPEVKGRVDDIAQRFYHRFACDEQGDSGKATCFDKLEELF